MSFDRSAISRLSELLKISADSASIERLTPDASTREFFRVPWQGETAIACVYPEPFDEALPQIDVTNLFLKANLPVAEIFHVDLSLGLLIHEDFGDRILRREIETSSDPGKYIDPAIGLIAKIQQATRLAFDTGSIASKRKFDVEKFSWELDFFNTHYFGSLRKSTLSRDTALEIESEFRELSEELETFSAVLTHRDFHAANLMVVGEQLRIIDHQDARIGPATYDLVSLLLDRIEELPSGDYISQKQELLQSARTELGLGRIERLEYEFDLVTVQRCLKAIGTFSNQGANFKKSEYLRFIPPMFRAVEQACIKLGRFPGIRRVVSTEAGRTA